MATGLSMSPPVLGSTKLARADAMNRMEPTMLIQAIHQGSDRGRTLTNRAADRQDGEGARHEEQRRAEEVRPPDVPVLLLHGQVVRQGGQRADVEEQRAGELGDRGEPVAVVRQPSPEPHRCASVLPHAASTPVIAGLWAWTSWAKEAVVKKIEPTK